MNLPDSYTEDRRKIDAMNEIIHQLLDFIHGRLLLNTLERENPDLYEAIEQMIKGTLLDYPNIDWRPE